MLRDKNLVPLSRQHQHALALCVRLDRAMQAGNVDLEAWQAEIQQHFEHEIALHFAAEEKEVFPLAARFAQIRPLVDQLLAEHAVLRDLFSRAASRSLEMKALAGFVEKLALHIRKEERELFEGLQEILSPAEIATLGTALHQMLEDVSKTCILPTIPRPRS